MQILALSIKEVVMGRKVSWLKKRPNPKLNHKTIKPEYPNLAMGWTLKESEKWATKN